MSEDRRNVSGSTGRIPQSCATRSLHWQESATFFSMHTAALRLYLFLILPACLSLLVFLCLAPSESVLLSPLPLSSFTLFPLFVFLLALCLSLSMFIYIFASYFVSYFSYYSFCLLFVPMHFLLMLLGIYTPYIYYYSVIVVWFIHSPNLHLHIFFWIESVFFCDTLSSLLQVLSRGHLGSAGEWGIKTQTYTFSVCLWIWHWHACY